MAEPNLKESEPLFWAYGHAVYAAQLLEHGIRLLLEIVSGERKKVGLPPVVIDLGIQTRRRHSELCLRTCLKVEYVIEAEKRIIWDAVRDRNILVHSYWDQKQTLAMLTSRGREWLVDDLLPRKEQCRKADAIISSMIDRYLAQYGISVHALATPLFEQWRNDKEPPDELLH